MFPGVEQDHGYGDNGERNRHAYSDDHDDDDNDNLDEETNQVIELRTNRTRRTLRHLDNSTDDNDEDVGAIHEDEHLESKYSCRYKCKALHTPAIRCRHAFTEQYEPQFYQHHHQQHQRAAAPQSVINLARCSSALDTLCAAEAAVTHMSPTSASHQHQTHHQQPHLGYGQTHHSPHIAVHQHYAATRHLEQRETQPHQQATTPPHATTVPPHTSIRTITPLTMSSPSSSSGTSATSSVAVAAAASAAAAAAAAAAANRRDHNIDYSTLFVQLSGTLPTLYRCVNCNKIVSNRWHHANIHRPQSHECPVCGQKFTRRDNMKAHCKIKHADIKDRFFSHYVHM